MNNPAAADTAEIIAILRCLRVGPSGAVPATDRPATQLSLAAEIVARVPPPGSRPLGRLPDSWPYRTRPQPDLTRAH